MPKVKVELIKKGDTVTLPGEGRGVGAERVTVTKVERSGGLITLYYPKFNTYLNEMRDGVYYGRPGEQLTRIVGKPLKGLTGPRAGGAAAKCVDVKAPLASFDRRSIRTVTRGTARILIGCPKGSWQPRKQRCKVGTRAYEVITPTKNGRCRRGARRR